MTPTTTPRVTLLTLAVATATTLAAQVQTEVRPVVPGARPVGVEHVTIHGTALEGNLEGNAVDRDAIVFLPPSYANDTSRRYPVVYALHGYSIGAEQWTREIHVPQTIEGAFARGVGEMIVVLPDSRTAHNGSMYSSSVTPLAFVDQYVGNLRLYRAIAIDVGDQDRLRDDARKLHEVLDMYAIPNSFEVYEGTHTSHVADRFQNHVLEFFGESLCLTADCR